MFLSVNQSPLSFAPKLAKPRFHLRTAIVPLSIRGRLPLPLFKNQSQPHPPSFQTFPYRRGRQYANGDLRKLDQLKLPASSKTFSFADIASASIRGKC